MKQAVLNLMRATGAFAPFRLANRNKALILTYHRFSHDGGAATTSARAFSEQLDYLTRRYRIVSLSSLAEYLSRGTDLPSGIAAIAIDDGYSDAYEIAFPILREYNVPATLFVVTQFVDRKSWIWTDKLRFIVARTKLTELGIIINNRPLHLMLDKDSSRLQAATRINSALKLMFEEEREGVILRVATALGVELPNLPPDECGPITWDQAREMDAAGVEIGSHTTTHPILTKIGDERLRVELCESRARLESMLGHTVDLFCYPNGDYDDRTSSAVQAAGYKCAVTVETGLNGVHSDLLRLRRVHTDNNLARFIQYTSGFEQVKNRLVYARKGATAGHSY